MISQTPVYNLMVVQKETGLKADVLRAWERRYDLPHPQRTAGGHRLYSEYDIALVKWLKGRQAEGLSISRAAELWKDLVEAGRDPLEEAILAKASPTQFQIPAGGTNIELLRQKWLEGCLAFDTLQAEEALNQAFALYPVEFACDAILRQGLQVIGDQWYLGKISPQQEHFASALAVRRLYTLITSAPQPTRSQTILIGCPFGELHAFPALLLSLFLQRRGLKVVYLGENIPLERMDDAVASIHPDLVVLAAQHLVTAASLASMARVLQDQGTPVAYGGMIFNRLPELRQRIAATFLGENLEEARDKVMQLVLAQASFPDTYVADDQYRALAELFQQARPSIEHALLEKLREAGLHIETVESVNAFMGSKLVAALELGHPAFIEDELDWIQGLIAAHRGPGNQLLPYLTTYSQCVNDELGQAGALITEWIDQYVSRNIPN